MNQNLLSITQISQEIGCSEKVIAGMLTSLPTGDIEDMTFLDAAGQWILEVSNLINNIFPGSTSKERVAKKFKLMGRILELKAEEIGN